MTRFATHAMALLDAVYAAATEPERWDDALRELARALEGTAAGLHIERDGVAVTQRWVGLESRFIDLYRGSFWRLDPWAAGARSLQRGEAGYGDRLTLRRSVEKSEFYNELSRFYGVDDLMAAALERSSSVRAFVSVVGGPKRRFGPDDAQRLARVIPHLQRALEIGERLNTFPFDTMPTLQDELRRRYQLTPAEARVACHVGRGMAPKEAAAALGSSWNTVRFQLRQIYAKTRTSGQSELSRLVTQLER